LIIWKGHHQVPKINYKIIALRDNPSFAEQAVDWFASKFNIPRQEYEKSIDTCIHTRQRVPQWYLAIDENNDIIGGCGLIDNDFVDRTDLYPYLCALYVEERARGNAIGSKLLEYVRIDAGKFGFDKLYLCTDHTSYYEKYGWRYIGVGHHPWGETSRIYEADTIRQPFLEKMDDFFSARVDIYDEHMLQDVEGCREGYIKMAELIPEGTKSILDLGCGTGLELEAIFKRFSNVSVVGIDLSQAMLDRLKQKYPDKNIQTLCCNYMKCELGEDRYDTAISFQTMHHYTHDEKVALYKKIYRALKTKGVYIECDYMVTDQAVEDELFAEYVRLKKELNIADDELYHFDTPCTIDNQVSMLKQAGFAGVKVVWRMGNTTMIVAKKS